MKFVKPLLIPTLTLLIIGVVVAAVLSITNYFTAPRIDVRRQQALDQAMAKLIPNATFTLKSQDAQQGITVYQSTQNGKVLGYIVCSSAMGYKSKVEVMTAFNEGYNVTGVVVTDCADESPGIGQKVGTDQAFLSQYVGYTAEQSVDAITGATYSSQAVTDAVNQAVAYLQGGAAQ